MLKSVETVNLFDLFHSDLIHACLRVGPFARTSSTQCQYIRLLIDTFHEFQEDLSLGLLDMLRNVVEALDGFDNSTNTHSNAEINGVSIRLCCNPIEFVGVFVSSLGIHADSATTGPYLIFLCLSFLLSFILCDDSQKIRQRMIRFLFIDDRLVDRVSRFMLVFHL